MIEANQPLAGFRAGDEDAVRAIYREYGGAVQTIARSIVGDPELSKEIVQQTFLKAWRSAASFDETRQFAPWLYAIARRTAIDALRRQKGPDQFNQRPRDDGSGVDPVSRVPDSETMTFERTWEVYEIRRAVDQLPDAEREVIRMSHLLGLSHPEIANKLGVPIGTVKSRSSRGLKRLAAALRHLSEAANQRPIPHVQGGEE